jgi:hypothetical protein
LWNGDGVVAEQGVGPAGDFEVVVEVAGGVLRGHPGQGVADGDPLVQRRQDTEAEPVPQGGLSDQQRCERRPGVHLMIRELCRTRHNSRSTESGYAERATVGQHLP